MSVIYVPPTFIQEAETAWSDNFFTTTSVASPSFTVQIGDLILVYAVLSDNLTTFNISNSGTSFGWSQAQVVAVSSFCYVSVWSVIATAAQSMTVTMTRGSVPSGDVLGGFNCLTFRNSDGIGASAKTNVASGAPSLALTTTRLKSALFTVSADWTAVDGTSRTWRTINSITPTSGNGLETTYFRNATFYTVYGAYYNDVGATGSKTTGLSAPAAQKYSIVSIEIKGTVLPSSLIAKHAIKRGSYY